MTTLLNPQSPIPLYRQLADRLAASIQAGDYAAGCRIPSELQLAAAYGIGRPTVRQAVEVLVRRGDLKRRRGAGTFVCERQQDVDLFSLDGTSTAFTKKGVQAQTRLAAPIRLIRVATDNGDSPFCGNAAYFLTRLTDVDAIPVLCEDIYLDPDLFAGIEDVVLEGRSLSAVAENHFHLKPVGGKQRFTIAWLSGVKARQLQVDTQTPLLKMQRYLHFPQKQNGVFSELWCRSDRFIFSQTLGGTVYA